MHDPRLVPFVHQAVFAGHSALFLTATELLLDLGAHQEALGDHERAHVSRRHGPSGPRAPWA